MAYRFYIFLSCFILSTTLFSQAKKLSPQAEISILTIAPGTSLNDAFGHSGFRVKDSKYGLDVVYNYGIYDFNTPNFYTKFAQGKLNYLIGKNYFTDFYNSYVRQNRTIEEQLLNINEAEKQKLFNYLETNYKPENRGYLYDFFFDNCATKIKDVTAKNLSNTITFNTPKELQPESFRTLIQNQLETNSWGSVGIDLALGSVIDKQATAQEHMFLPKYIHLFFNEATVANKPLVKKDFVLFKQREISSSTTFISSPFFVFSLLGLIIIGITYSDYKNQRRTKILDIILFAFTGIVGIFILLLWFATDHEATAQNYNLLWAFALNLIVIGQVFKKTPKAWFIKYLKFLIIMLCLLTFHWVVGIQVFAIALLPFLLALVVRYLFLVRYYKMSFYS